MKVLVTGSTGYIGSHTCIELAKAGVDIVGVDNLSNSKKTVHSRAESIIGKPFPFYEADIRDEEVMNLIFKAHRFDAVIHFAGLKAVGESVSQAHRYYTNNVQGSLMLIAYMMTYGVKRMVFSSSATVYGDPDTVPITEDSPLRTTNPYGASKLMVENILRDHAHSQALANSPWGIAILRYFNPAGAHESGLIGEDPNDIPNNLMPYVSQVATGRRERLSVFGGDYPTPDGTGVRDYIHVVDLAKGHVSALQKIMKDDETFAVNLGTGKGNSVLEVVKAFEKVSGKAIPYTVTDRRAGDVAVCYADTQMAEEKLGWRAECTLEDMCASAWKWQSSNP